MRSVVYRPGRRVWLGRQDANRLGVRPGWVWAKSIEGEVIGGRFIWFACDLWRDGRYLGLEGIGIHGFGVSKRHRGGR